MCGIAGIFAYAGAGGQVDREELVRIRDSMAARGPDGEGLWVSESADVGLAHRRLAIIDLTPSGAQPMATANGRYRIVFNGEIYNYRELRKELQARGVVFHSASDTEVLLHLYSERGAQMVHALRGMYAFGIHDSLSQELFLARDPFGIKPLYIADDGRTLRFASQAKALIKGGNVDTRPSAAGLVGFYLWGHVPEPHTLYKGVRALPAGTTLLVDSGGRRDERRYFSIAEEFSRTHSSAPSQSNEDRLAQIGEALRDSIRHHLVADVPVGVFLSSGLDSTTITGVASEAATAELRTFTLGFNEYRGTENDETTLATQVARRYGTVHATEWVSRADFVSQLEEILEAMDQPSIDGVNTYFVSRAAAKCGMKVALSGIGGDELFGGYPSFDNVPRMAKLLGPAAYFPRFGKSFRRVCAPVLKRFTSPKFAGLLEYGGSYSGAYLLRRGLFMPWELPALLDGELVREGWGELQPLLRLEQTIGEAKTPFQKVSALELSWYMKNQLLRDADWAGMAHSLEIRVPLVDVELFRALLPMTASQRPTKSVLAGALSRPLPESIIGRRKTGFSIPVQDWLRQASPGGAEGRGIRGWAQKLVPPRPRAKRVLVLVTDAFGGHGGIANFNRDFLSALCAHEGISEVVVFARHAPVRHGLLPGKINYVYGAEGSKVRFTWSLLRYAMSRPEVDLLVCAHINLLPLGYLMKRWFRVPMILEIFGIDAWQPTESRLANQLARKVDAVVSISDTTRRRFAAWSGCAASRISLLPNAIRMEEFGPGPKSRALLERYGLGERTILMTLGRIVSQERYKGFDEILDLLPSLSGEVANIAYLIVGEGTDRVRLEEKARRLGVADRVVFAGYIEEAEKADHYRIADAYVMPSRGEGFGFVFLEALACGVPAVGSVRDGSREALRDGKLGLIVDPDDQSAVRAAILSALRRPRGVPDGLDYFSYENFTLRVHQVVDRVVDIASRSR